MAGALPLSVKALLPGLARGHGHIPVPYPLGWGWWQEGKRDGGGHPPAAGLCRVPVLKAALHLPIAQQPRTQLSHGHREVPGQ